MRTYLGLSLKIDTLQHGHIVFIGICCQTLTSIHSHDLSRDEACIVWSQEKQRVGDISWIIQLSLQWHVLGCFLQKLFVLCFIKGHFTWVVLCPCIWLDDTGCNSIYSDLVESCLKSCALDHHLHHSMSGAHDRGFRIGGASLIRCQDWHRRMLGHLQEWNSDWYQL